jgi:hypothetical protein
VTRALLALQAATQFEITPARRLKCTNDPERTPAPLLYMAGCAEGWIGYVREDVAEDAARAFAETMTREPPLKSPGASPRFVADYCALAGGAEAPTAHNFGPIHRSPRGRTAATAAEIVCQGTPAGDALWERFCRDGVPDGLKDAGFTDPSHFWEPWCVRGASHGWTARSPRSPSPRARGCWRRTSGSLRWMPSAAAAWPQR